MKTTENNHSNGPEKTIEFDPETMTRAGYERLKYEQEQAEHVSPAKKEVLRDLRDLSELMHSQILALKCLSGLLGNQNDRGGLGCTPEELAFAIDPIIDRLSEIQKEFSDFSYRKYAILTKSGNQNA